MAPLKMTLSKDHPAGRLDVIVFAMVLLVAVVCSGTGVVGAHESPSSQQQTGGGQSFEGIVTDSHCAAKHSTEIALSAANCTIQCVRMGERFSLVDGEANYTLEGDLQLLKRVAGQRVKVSGTLQGNVLAFSSVNPD